MGQNSTGGRSLVTAATVNHCASQFWNAHSTARVWVTEFSYCRSAAAVSANNLALSRTSARGATPTVTITPDIDNAYEQDIADPSTCVLELATFGTQPTLDGPDFWRGLQEDFPGTGFSKVFDPPGLAIEPGTGLALYTTAAVTLKAGDHSVHWHS